MVSLLKNTVSPIAQRSRLALEEYLYPAGPAAVSARTYRARRWSLPWRRLGTVRIKRGPGYRQTVRLRCVPRRNYSR